MRNTGIILTDSQETYDKFIDIQHDFHTSITFLPSEGHQWNSVGHLIRGCIGRREFKSYILGNFTKPHDIQFEDNFKVKLIPYKYVPFDIFTPYNSQVNYYDVVEPTRIKLSKVGFIYFGNRPERDVIVSKLHKQRLFDNVTYHSDSKQKDTSDIRFSTNYDLEKLGFYDYESYENVRKLLPKYFVEHNHYHDDYYPSTIELASESLFYIISESNLGMENTVNVLTEKSAVPFFSKSIPIFITYNPIESIEWFKKLGFDCFTDIISEDIYKLPFNDMLDTILNIVQKIPLNFYEENIDRFNSNFNLAVEYTHKPTTLYNTLDSITSNENMILGREM